MSYYHHLIKFALPPSYLLDTYSGGLLAFSLRKVSSSYIGSCIRVRRSSDNAELDIGFIGEDLDTVALLAFCGVSSGFVAKWYDQSGYANHALQVSASVQPRIVLNGVLEVLDGTANPAIVVYGGGVRFTLTSLVTCSSQFTSVNVYRKITSDETVGISGSGAPYPFLHFTGSQVLINTAGPAGIDFGNKSFPNNYIGISYKNGSNNGGVFFNGTRLGSELALGASVGNFQYVLSRVGSGSSFKYSEAIFFNVNHLADMSPLFTNLNTYYGIY